MGHYHLNLQAGDPNVQKQATQVGMASSIIYPITLTNRSKYVYLTNQNKTPLTKSNPDGSCFRKTTLFPLNLPASMISTVPGVILALEIEKINK